jgi:hypothetical protein
LEPKSVRRRILLHFPDGSGNRPFSEIQMQRNKKHF